MNPPQIVPCQGDGCDASIVQQPIDVRRQFCDDCRKSRKRAGSKAWKRVNPDRLAKYQRERRQRRRYDTTRRTA